MIHTWNMYLKRGTYIKCYFWQQTCRKCFQIKKYIYKICITTAIYYSIQKKNVLTENRWSGPIFVQGCFDYNLLFDICSNFVCSLLYMTFAMYVRVWILLMTYVYTYLKYTWGSFANTISLNRDSFQGGFGLGTRKFAFSIL